MPVPKPRIHPMAEQHLRDLRERWHVEPTLAEALWIVQLCDRVLNPVEGERHDLCGMPIRVGQSDIHLWPLTIGATCWLHDKAFRWFEGEDKMGTLAYWYALAHGRDRDAIREAGRSPEAARRIITDWTDALPVRLDEMEEACDRVCPVDNGDTPSPSASGGVDATTDCKTPDWAEIVGEAEAITGIPSDHWVWDVSLMMTVNAWRRARAVLIAQAGGGYKGGGAADAAFNDLVQARKAIIDAHQSGVQA